MTGTVEETQEWMAVVHDWPNQQFGVTLLAGSGRRCFVLITALDNGSEESSTEDAEDSALHCHLDVRYPPHQRVGQPAVTRRLSVAHDSRLRPNVGSDGSVEAQYYWMPLSGWVGTKIVSWKIRIRLPTEPSCSVNVRLYPAVSVVVYANALNCTALRAWE